MSRRRARTVFDGWIWIRLKFGMCLFLVNAIAEGHVTGSMKNGPCSVYGWCLVFPEHFNFD